uniref:Uncharacterized protein n=1 Tax=Cynoglossus semilaevis TaxID=244447 RepID=A0A3P8WX63_CYNSE
MILYADSDGILTTASQWPQAINTSKLFFFFYFCTPYLVLVLLCWYFIYIDSVLVAVPQGSTAILPCEISSREDIQTEVFDWKKVEDRTKEVFLYDRGPNYNKGREGQDLQFRQRVFHFQDELKNGNASIKILRTTLENDIEMTQGSFLYEIIIELLSTTNLNTVCIYSYLFIADMLQ